MGSFRHPKFYDPVTLKSVREVFHDIVDVLDGHCVIPLGANEQKVKADIVERLLQLAADGTPQNKWISKVLSSLSLR